MTGAILEDADAEALIAEDSSFTLDTPSESNSLFTPVNYFGQIYECRTPVASNKFEWWGPHDNHLGPTYFADIIDNGVKSTFHTEDDGEVVPAGLVEGSDRPFESGRGLLIAGD